MKRPAEKSSVKRSVKHNVDDRVKKRQTNPDKTPKEKKARKPDDAQQEKDVKPSQVSVLKTEERAFPRGGTTALSALEHKKAIIKASKEVLFEETGQKRPAPGSDSDEEVYAEAELRSGPKKKRKTKKSVKAEITSGKEEPRIRIESLNYKVSSVLLGP